MNFILRPDVIYVVDDFNWVIKDEGQNYLKSLGDKISFRPTSSHFAPKGTIIHFGDIYTFFTKRGLKKINPESPIILTWYHIVENDVGFKHYDAYVDRISYLHISNKISKEELLRKGFPEEKIFFAHIPVDTDVYNRKRTKEEAKVALNIPKEKIVIGSFQKDGNGWGEGLEPKLVKGPDIFCDIVEKLAEELDIHVLLSGPSRGYVINRLKNKNISYSHFYFDDPKGVIDLYEALDLYLMTSRVEGGPKSLPESWAMGVPYAGTRVGMVEDVGVDGRNFIEINIEDIEGSALKVKNYLSNSNDAQEQLIDMASQDLGPLTLKSVSAKYLEIYQELKK